MMNPCSAIFCDLNIWRLFVHTLFVWPTEIHPQSLSTKRFPDFQMTIFVFDKLISSPPHIQGYIWLMLWHLQGTTDYIYCKDGQCQFVTQVTLSSIIAMHWSVKSSKTKWMHLLLNYVNQKSHQKMYLNSKLSQSELSEPSEKSSKTK